MRDARPPVRHYVDAYGQRAVAWWNAQQRVWQLTFLRGPGSYTRLCRSEQRVRITLESNGYCWSEV